MVVQRVKGVTASVAACNVIGPVASTVDPVTTLRLVLDLCLGTHPHPYHIHTHTHSHHMHTHTHTHITHTHTQTHPHTHTRTHPHTHTHSKQALSPIHEICRFLWILKANKLFVCASSNELWAHHFCRQFQIKIVCTKLFHCTGTCQTLGYAIDCDHLLLRQSGHFSMATVWGPFKTTAFEDNSGTRQQLMARFPGKYYAPCWPVLD